MGKSPIEWTENTWNPIGGCRKVSPGCKKCYAIPNARRMGGNPKTPRYKGLTVIDGNGPNWSGKTFIDEDVLREPLKRREPTTYFISLSDLFYDQRSDEDIDRVFAVMALCPQHKFLVLTKYHERMAAYVNAAQYSRMCSVAQGIFAPRSPRTATFPLENVGLGVSVEDQQRADERISVLLQTPAAMRFVSAEPLLGELDLTAIKVGEDRSTCRERYDVLRGKDRREHLRNDSTWNHRRGDDPAGDPCWTGNRLPKLDWVIPGAESGHGARPCAVAWIRSIVQQCQAAAVPVFVKQFGSMPSDAFCEMGVRRLGDRKGGEMEEWPADLRVRELPAFLWRSA